MLFTEPAFLFLFLPVVLALYFATPQRGKNLVLTAASLVFYALGEWSFVPWLLASTALNYFVALGLDRYRGRPAARWLLIGGITSDLALLFAFKYSAFFVSNLDVVLEALHARTIPIPALPLPLGISFFTFHKISYKVDVATGAAEVRRDPLDLLLYILVFPQLLAGPIVRYREIAADLLRRTVTRAGFAEGVRRFVEGLAKKLLIANTLAPAGDLLFFAPADQVSTQAAWIGILCRGLQVYFDFSGYSDMAIGLARMFGFNFPENFDYPYAATSMTEFWSRWHMSLSRWLRDYLYYPLGGSKRGTLRTYFNLFVVFFLCGLWHGASWHFVAWGLFNGALLMGERAGTYRLLQRAPLLVRHLYKVFFVMVGVVFFRSETLAQAGNLLRALAGLGPVTRGELTPAMMVNSVVAVALVVGLIFAFPPSTRLRRWLDNGLASAGAVLAMLALSCMQVASGTYNPFIYFRF